jgi:hypothetical protein
VKISSLYYSNKHRYFYSSRCRIGGAGRIKVRWRDGIWGPAQPSPALGLRCRSGPLTWRFHVRGIKETFDSGVTRMYSIFLPSDSVPNQKSSFEHRIKSYCSIYQIGFPALIPRETDPRGKFSHSSLWSDCCIVFSTRISYNAVLN